MLYYYCTSEKSLKKIEKKGIQDEVMLRAIEEVDHCSKKVMLVIDPLKLSLKEHWYGEQSLTVPRVPPEAIQNIRPYQKPCLVIAGGGFVVREHSGEKEMVLIRRKGKWDIPKGKLDEGESYAECAVREVQEEIGIEDVRIVQPLGSTFHCYERKGRFCVKRTYWYEMQTADTTFYPQEEEDIEEVAWFTWAQAQEALGYPIFKMHMSYVEPRVM